jgi:hypothetical protein
VLFVTVRSQMGIAVSVQFCWPTAFKNLAVCVQDLVAADGRFAPRWTGS